MAGGLAEAIHQLLLQYRDVIACLSEGDVRGGPVRVVISGNLCTSGDQGFASADCGYRWANRKSWFVIVMQHNAMDQRPLAVEFLLARREAFSGQAAAKTHGVDCAIS